MNIYDMKYLFVILLITHIANESLHSQQFTEVAVELGVEDSTKLDGLGVHWIDFNGDNLLDLYVVNPFAFIIPYRPVSNRLFMNQIPTTGKFIDVAALVNAGVDTGISRAAGWADFDNNSYIDFFVVNGIDNFGAPDVAHQIFENNGSEFHEVGNNKGINLLRVGDFSVSIGDPDGDGDQDIYVVNHFWEKNMLLRNDGNVFIDVAEEWGIADHEGGGATNGNGAIWGDYDNDGDLDLYVINARFKSRLYRNDLSSTGVFTEMTFELGVENMGTALTAAWGDYDNDGDLDLFVANSRKTLENIPNRLYRNDIESDGVFVEVAAELNLADSGKSISAAWGDYDNDGDLDLFVTKLGTANRLYRNDVTDIGIFTEVGEEQGVASDDADWAASWGDYDNDGDLDLYVTNESSPVSIGLNLLYRNEQNDLNYLKVRPLSANGSYSRHGSRVYLYKAGTDSLVGMRDSGGGTGLSGSQNQYDAHFGLDGTKAYDIVVRFTTRVNGENIVIDKNVRPELGGLVPVDIGGFIEVRDSVNVIVSVEDEPEAVLPGSPILYQNYPNPFNSETLILFYLPKREDVKIIVYNILGERVFLLHEGNMPAGEHQISWDASRLPSGIYFYHLQAGEFVETKKMLLLK